MRVPSSPDCFLLTRGVSVISGGPEKAAVLATSWSSWLFTYCPGSVDLMSLEPVEMLVGQKKKLSIGKKFP